MKLTPKEDGSGLEFRDWAVAKYKESCAAINPCENGKMDPVKLNECLVDFAQHFSWAIVMSEIESNKLNILQHEWERWYKTQYNIAFRLIMEEQGGVRAPGQETIGSRIVDLVGDEMEGRQKALVNQKSRVDLLKGLVKVLATQASVLQTLSSNMRSELFYAGGVTVGGAMTQNDKNIKSKAVLHNAMRANREK